MRLQLVLALLLLLPSFGAEITWDQLRKSPEFLSVRKSLSDHLPDLAIPGINELLSKADLTKAARAELLTTLGEAQIRNGQPEIALLTLDADEVRDFDSAHLWRGYALSRMARYHDAISEFEKVDDPDLQNKARLQIATLFATLGDSAKSREILDLILDSKSQKDVIAVKLQIVARALKEGQTEEAASYLEEVSKSETSPSDLTRFLAAKLYLQQGEQENAIQAFRSLLEGSDKEKQISAPIFHEAELGLADSLALGNQEKVGIAELLRILEKDPNHPRIEEIFSRLNLWSSKTEKAPLLNKLAEWVPAAVQDSTAYGFMDGESAATFSTTTSDTTITSRSLYSLSFLARENLQAPEDPQRKLGVWMVARLQLLERGMFPNLIAQSLMDLGLMRMESKQYDLALISFNNLHELGASPLLKARGNALAGFASFALEEPNRSNEYFIAALELAKEIKDEQLRVTTTINAGVTALAAGQPEKLDPVVGNLKNKEVKAYLALERGLYLASKNNPESREFLARFLTDFPSGGRASKATLHLAESLVFIQPTRLDLARSLVEKIKFDQATQPRLYARKLQVLLALNLGAAQTIEFLTRWPEHPMSERLLFQAGQTYRRIKEPGQAYITFEKFLERFPRSHLADSAKFLSALSALASSSESAAEDASLKLRDLIDQRSILSHEAALVLVSLLIDLDQQEEALVEVEKLNNDSQLSLRDRERLTIMKADALGQLGQYEQALMAYDELLTIENLDTATRNQGGYHKGMTLEKLGRKTQALEAYLEVINRELGKEGSKSLEWKWFDKCGLEGALSLLEREERWEAAAKLALRLSASGSPRAKDALTAAERIAAEHKIVLKK